MRGNRHDRKKLRSRALAFLLSFVMITGTFIGDYTMASAEELTTDAGIQAVAPGETGSGQGEDQDTAVSTAASASAAETVTAGATVDETQTSETKAGESKVSESQAAETTDTETEATEATETTATETTETVQEIVITFHASEGGTVSLDSQTLGEDDEVQSVSATADDGYQFVDWTSNGAEVSTEATFTPEKKSAEYVANFVLDMPAVNFEETVNGTVIRVAAPEGAFPAGTSMTASDVSAQISDTAITDAVQDENGEDAEVQDKQAFDITFTDASGKEIEPATKIDVTFTPADLTGESMDVFHMEDTSAIPEFVGNSDTVDQAKVSVDAFSIYVLVGTTKIASEYYVAVGDTVTLQENAEGTQTWSSSDATVAEVKNENGTVTALAKKAGDATITSGVGKDSYTIHVTGNIPITWKKLTAANRITGSSLNWQWEAVADKLTTDRAATVWDGYTSKQNYTGYIKASEDPAENTVHHNFATWNCYNGGNYAVSDFYRYQGTFTIPAGYSTADHYELYSAASSLYKQKIATLGTKEGIVPINDDIYVFIYPQGTKLTNQNYQQYLAFWTGVSAASKSGTLNSFLGITGTEPIRDTNLKKTILSHTDGRYCVASIDNVGNVMFNNSPSVGAGTQFVIDVITADHANGGGMDELALDVEKNPAPTFLVHYYKDSIAEGNLLTSSSNKGLTTGTDYDFSSDATVIDAGKSTLYAKYPEYQKANITATLSGDTKFKTGNTGNYVMNVVYTRTPATYQIAKYYQQADGTYSSTASTISAAISAYAGNSVSVPDTEKTAFTDQSVSYVYDTAASQNTVSGTVAADNSTVLKVYFKRQYTVRFLQENGSTVISNKTDYSYNNAVGTAPEAPAKEGDGYLTYSFAGWEKGSTVYSAADAAKIKVTQNMDFVAVYSSAPDVSGYHVTSYSGKYDGQSHSITFSGKTKSTDTVEYSTNGTDWSITNPTQKDVTAAPVIVYVRVLRDKAVIWSGNATITITKRTITFVSGGTTWVYNGQIHTLEGVTIDSATDGFAAGEGATYTGYKAVKDVCNNVNNTFTVVANEGTDLTKNYTVSYTYGKLSVVKDASIITVTAGSASKVYDGTPLTDGNYTFTVGADSKTEEQIFGANGDHAVVTFTQDSTATDVSYQNGSIVPVANKIEEVKVLDAENQDVTANYDFAEKTVDGTLLITPSAVTITAPSVNLTANGSAQTVDTVANPFTYAMTDVNSADLIRKLGQDISVTYDQASLTRTEAGTNNIVISAAKIMQNGTDVSGNYVITLVPGTLTMSAAPTNNTTTTVNTTTTTTTTTSTTGAVLGVKRGIEATTPTDNTAAAGEVLGASRSPKTSDESKAILWMLVMGASGVGLAALLAKKKRGQQDESDQ